MESHLLQMRGLKQSIAKRYLSAEGVASFTDAWIETPYVSRQCRSESRIFYRCVD